MTLIMDLQLSVQRIHDNSVDVQNMSNAKITDL